MASCKLYDDKRIAVQMVSFVSGVLWWSQSVFWCWTRDCKWYAKLELGVGRSAIYRVVEEQVASIVVEVWPKWM